MIQILCFVAALWICSNLPNKTLRIIGATFGRLRCPPWNSNAPALVTVAGGIILAVLGLRWIWKHYYEPRGNRNDVCPPSGSRHAWSGASAAVFSYASDSRPTPGTYVERYSEISTYPFTWSAADEFIRRTDQLDIVGKGLSGDEFEMPIGYGLGVGDNSR